MNRIDGTPGSAAASADLMQVLATLSPAQLAPERAAVERLAREARNDSIREGAFLALMQIDGDADRGVAARVGVSATAHRPAARRDEARAGSGARQPAGAARCRPCAPRRRPAPQPGGRAGDRSLRAAGAAGPRAGAERDRGRGHEPGRERRPQGHRDAVQHRRRRRHRRTCAPRHRRRRRHGRQCRQGSAGWHACLHQSRAGSLVGSGPRVRAADRCHQPVAGGAGHAHRPVRRRARRQPEAGLRPRRAPDHARAGAGHARRRHDACRQRRGHGRAAAAQGPRGRRGVDPLGVHARSGAAPGRDGRHSPAAAECLAGKRDRARSPTPCSRTCDRFHRPIAPARPSSRLSASVTSSRPGCQTPNARRSCRRSTSSSSASSASRP